jgi:hypothetical protein
MVPLKWVWMMAKAPKNGKEIMRKAVTLVELMIAVFIILFALVALVGAFTSAFTLVALAQESTIATDDLEDVLEYINTLPYAHITEPANGGFNDGDTVNAAVIGGFLLEDEVITASYPLGTNADPLEIGLTVTWSGRYGRNGTLTFRTARTSGL